MKENFIAINFSDKDNKLLFNYPLIYFWDGNGELEDAFKTEEFKDFIINKINKDNFWSTNVYLIYIYTDEEDENQYINKEFKISDILEVNQDLLDEYILEVLDFLYGCAFKTHLENDNILDAYKAIKKKYPKKITYEVVSNYIRSKISETYPEIPEDILDKIENTFLENIKDEL